MKIIHNGQAITCGKKTDHVDMREWRNARTSADRGLIERMDRIATEGTITDDRGVPLARAKLERVRHRLLGTYDNRPEIAPWRDDSGPQERDWLIPGLWPWGTIPALGGNPKAGKTTVIVDLVTALVTSEYRFLGHFEPSRLLDHDIFPIESVWVINAETPAADLRAELERHLNVPSDFDDLPAYELVKVVNLEQLGGAHLFDLTVPAIYDWWFNELITCTECEGRDDNAPVVLIVDGLTAILGGSTAKYGEWYAAFRRLVRSLDIPNALVVAHNTMEGGHLMGGVEAQAGPDGLWSYSAAYPDNPASVRRFSVRPRVGGVAVPPMKVSLVEDRLVARKGEVAMAQQAGSEPRPDEVLVVAQKTADYVREHPGADGEELSHNVEPRSKKQSLKGRAKAVELGLIREQKCGPECSICVDRKPFYRRTHHFPADQALDPVTG